MALDWSVVFAGISALNAIVQMSRDALETRGPIGADLERILNKAEAEASANASRAVRAGKQLRPLDEQMLEVLREKIEDARRKWIKTVNPSGEPIVWYEATDQLGIEICNILRLVKQLNGGKLPPGEWYDLWVRNACR